MADEILDFLLTFVRFCTKGCMAPPLTDNELAYLGN